MKARVVFFVFSLAVPGALLLASCGSGATTAPATSSSQPTSSRPSATAVPSTTMSPATDTPKYGGGITYRLASDPLNFDSASQPSGGALLGTVYQTFMTDDWMRGPDPKLPKAGRCLNRGSGSSTFVREFIGSPQKAKLGR